MSTELGSYKQNMATLEAELEILRKQDTENREQLQKTASQMHKNRGELLATKEALTGKDSARHLYEIARIVYISGPD